MSSIAPKAPRCESDNNIVTECESDNGLSIDRQVLSMLYSVGSNAAYLAAKAQIAANSKSKTVSGLSSGSDGTFEANVSLRIKESIALAILRGDRFPGPNALEVELNEAYLENERLKQANSFDSDFEVWVCEDDSSTDEKPVMYVEVETGGERNAHLIDIGSINIDDMTKAEALALNKYMGKTPGWTDPTYSDMVSALSSLLGKLESASDDDSGSSSLVDQVNQYYKPTFTYDSSGKYSASSGYASFLEQNRDLRESARALKLQNILQSITVDESGRKTLSGGIYM